MDTFTPQLIVNVLWGCATLGHIDPPFIDALVDRAHRTLDWFQPADLPSVAWSLSKLNAAHLEPLFELFYAKVYDLYSLDDCAAVASA